MAGQRVAQFISLHVLHSINTHAMLRQADIFCKPTSSKLLLRQADMVGGTKEDRRARRKRGCDRASRGS